METIGSTAHLSGQTNIRTRILPYQLSINERPGTDQMIGQHQKGLLTLRSADWRTAFCSLKILK